MSSGINYTTTSLLDNTRTNCLTPEADALFTDTRLLSILTFEQMTTLVPQIMKVQEEYFVHVYDILLSSSTTGRYPMPDRAVGKKLRDVALVDSNGNEQYITRMNPADVKFLNPSVTAQSQWVNGFYLENNSVVLFAGVPVQYTYIRYRYYRRPNNLVAVGDAAQISVIDTLTKTLTCSSVPGDWVVGDTVDFISQHPSFDSLQDDATITGINNSDVTFAALPTGLEVGDWISLSGTTPIPQLPYEAHPVLGQLGACKALEAMGDANVEMAWARYKQMSSDFYTSITPRTDSPAQKIVSPNNISQRGYLRGGNWWR